jgi:hypothetical protein
MKKNLFALLSLIIIFSFTNCTKEEEDDIMKGLVNYASGPDYNNGNLSFKAQIQYATAGKAAIIEYQILEGTDLIESGTSNADENPDGMGIWFQTGTISIALPASEYSGKTITVWLDPDNKVTSSEYTTPTSVDLWKKADVVIP